MNYRAAIIAAALIATGLVSGTGYGQSAALQPASFDETVREQVPTNTPGVLRGLHYAAPGQFLDVSRLSVVLPPGQHAWLCLIIETQDGHYYAEATYNLGGLAGARRYYMQLHTDYASLLGKYTVRDVATSAFVASDCDAQTGVYLPVLASGGATSGDLVFLINNATPGIDTLVYDERTRRAVDCARDKTSERLVAFDTECEVAFTTGGFTASLLIGRSRYGTDLEPVPVRVYLP